MKCSDCLKYNRNDSKVFCEICRENQQCGDWIWYIDNGHRHVRCPACGFGLPIDFYAYKNPYKFCPGCGRRNLLGEQTKMDV